MAMNDHRKDLLSLSQGRAQNRRELDRAVSLEMEIFGRIAVNYNNEKVIVKNLKELNVLTLQMKLIQMIYPEFV